MSEGSLGAVLAETPASAIAVEARGVAKSFNGQRVLSGIDLRVERGELVVIVGPSGAGKSTLLHLLAGLDSPDAGSITVDGTDVTRIRALTRYRRDKVGLVFQLHNLIPRLTALQNVEMAMFDSKGSRREHRNRAIEVLQAVGLSSHLHSYPPTMSGGERQRVAVARALANRPSVLLADEPTGSLDDKSAGEVLGLFRRIQTESDLTIVAVSHDPRLNDIADRLVYLSNGEISDTPPPQDENEAQTALARQLEQAAEIATQAGLGEAALWINRRRPQVRG